MDIDKAIKLSYDLRRHSRWGRLLRADVEGDRIVFSGGSQGTHSIDVGVSSLARVLAHWEGYCEQNGMPAPRVGETVTFIGNNGKTTYRGIVAAVGPKRAAIDFHYHHGGAAHAKVWLGDILFAPRSGGAS